MSRNKIRGNMFKMDDNPRIISGIGHFIRRTSLDEFPWFFNQKEGLIPRSLLRNKLFQDMEEEIY